MATKLIMRLMMRLGRQFENHQSCKNLSKSKKTETGFLTSGAKKALIKLKQAFIKALILNHFDPEQHIWVETDASGYAIGGVFNQLTLDDLD